MSQYPNLYNGERLETVQGRPILFKFSPSFRFQGVSHTPLLVFVPGAAHLARLAYGGHICQHPSDFLAHWLNHAGFNVLAVSYPLESTPPILPQGHPDLGMPEWGDLTAETARMVVQEEGLMNEVILLCWSMGGKILKPFMKAAKRRSIAVPLFISLAATPGGVTGLRTYPTAHRTEAGYSTTLGLEQGFLSQIREQERLNGDRVIIEDDIYLSEYFGHTPIRLANWGLTYSPSGPFLREEGEALRDAGPESSDYDDYPFIGIIHGTAPSDLRHSLADKATWGMVLTYKLLSDVGKLSISQESRQWQELTQLIHSAPDRMHARIQGNHFFFLGERGARLTAEAISSLVQKMGRLKSEMDILLENFR